VPFSWILYPSQYESMSLHKKQISGNSTGPIAYGVKAFSWHEIPQAIQYRTLITEAVVAMVKANEKAFPI